MRDVRVWSKADVTLLNFDVCFTPKSRHSTALSRCPLWAKLRHMHRSKRLRYSITSSAATSMVFGTTSASASAVLRLITITNLVGSTTARLAGFSPFRILAT